MNSPFTMIIWVVAIVCVTAVLKKRYEYRHSRMHDDLDRSEVQEKLERLDRLEERVKVLEAIVTDRNYELRRELDDLDRAS